MVYEADVMLPIEVGIPSWMHSQFDQEMKDLGKRCSTDLIDEVRIVSHTRDFTAKQKLTKINNS